MTVGVWWMVRCAGCRNDAECLFFRHARAGREIQRGMLFQKESIRRHGMAGQERGVAPGLLGGDDLAGGECALLCEEVM